MNTHFSSLTFKPIFFLCFLSLSSIWFGIAKLNGFSIEVGQIGWSKFSSVVHSIHLNLYEFNYDRKLSKILEIPLGLLGAAVHVCSSGKWQVVCVFSHLTDSMLKENNLTAQVCSNKESFMYLVTCSQLNYPRDWGTMR